MVKNPEYVQGSLDKVLEQVSGSDGIIRPGDPNYESPMEAIHGPTGLQRQNQQVDEEVIVQIGIR